MRIHVVIVCLALFILAFVPRLYHIDNPVADWHSWRQADTAAVSRNFIKEGLSPLYPKFDSYFDLNEVEADNPNRYFFAEFPLYNLLTYPLYQIFGVQEMYARLVSVVASSLATVFLYLLTRKYSSERAAVIAGIFFAILPFNIYYGRVVMPDPLHIMFQILTLLTVSIWLEKSQDKAETSSEFVWASLAGITWTAALLTKPYAIILALPIAYLVLRKWKWATFSRRSVYLFGMIALTPFLLWRWHIDQHPEGKFGTSWLYNQGNIRFTGAYFRWLIFERMNRLIFATGGFVLFWLGVIRGRSSKEDWFYYFWLASVLLFFVVIAKGNVTHDYYQLPLVPIGAIFMAKGLEFLAMYGRGLKHRMVNFNIGIILVVLMLAFGWYEVRGFFNINHPEIVEAGKAADRLLPLDAKVIAPYQSDSAFLYQTNRYGWTVGEGLIPEFIEAGATHLVSVNYDDTTNEWMKKCTIVEKTDRWVIIDLKNCQK